MTKDEFFDQFITQWIATWSANHYDEYCAMGQHAGLYNPPIEDAEFIALEVWDKLGEHNVVNKDSKT